MRNTFKTVALAAMLMSSLSAHAGIVVIGSPDVTGLATKADVKKLFLGKTDSLNGVKVKAIEIDNSVPQKEQFHQAITGKSLVQLQSYWAKQLFTGKSQPPEEVASQDAAKEKVASGSGLIGYVDESMVDRSVNVLVKL